MALTLADLKLHCNITGTADDAVLTRLLAVAQKRIEQSIGYAFTDTDELPTGAPADLEHAVYMTAASLYENREAVLVGGGAMVMPLAVADVIADYRRYTFGACEAE